jgi:hypothetical protein
MRQRLLDGLHRYLKQLDDRRLQFLKR